MTSLFDNSQTELFSSSSSEHPVSNNVAEMVEQLIAQGYDAEEAGAAVLRYIDKQKTEQHNANGSAMKLRTDKERAQYMRKLRSQVSSNVWIPPQLQEEYASEQRLAEAQEQFKQNMKARASQGGMMRSTQAAIEFFRNKP
ncbi:hypothetical protein [Pantoea ananatis]|uniref:hypothetical protein n=1 Tax=Pantoea ananas TaxID=553 RepID=UPI0011A464E9|nr:hypothetical protein [Pantoea ananatis]